jgi:hypothetical protein
MFEDVKPLLCRQRQWQRHDSHGGEGSHSAFQLLQLFGEAAEVLANGDIEADFAATRSAAEMQEPDPNTFQIA